MTPTEKLNKIKDILCPEDQGKPDLNNYPNVMADRAIQALDRQAIKFPSFDPTVVDLLHKILAKVSEAIEIINEPEINPGDRFPHITIQEPH